MLGTSLLAPQMRHLPRLCAFINFTYLLTYLLTYSHWRWSSHNCPFMSTLSCKVSVNSRHLIRHEAAQQRRRGPAIQIDTTNYSDFDDSRSTWQLSYKSSIQDCCVKTTSHRGWSYHLQSAVLSAAQTWRALDSSISQRYKELKMDRVWSVIISPDVAAP